MKVGDQLQLKLRGPVSSYVVLYVGPYTVRLRRSDGVEVTAKRRTIAKQIGGGLAPYPTAARPKMISTPMGGAPTRKR